MPNEIPAATRIALSQRSDRRCELNRAHPAQHAHHRQRRASRDHSLANLLHVCRRCHDWLHAHRPAAELHGWILSSYAEPAEAPVDIVTAYGAGSYRLEADGLYVPIGWLDISATFVLEPAAA